VLLATYLLGATIDVAGVVLATLDLRHRLRMLRAYRRPVESSLTLEWNTESDTARRVFGARNPMIIEQTGVEAVERIRSALEEERQARAAAETRLATLAGVTDSLGRLKLSAGLIAGGVLLSSAGNIASAWPT
jgi:hypothetical protein